MTLSDHIEKLLAWLSEKRKIPMYETIMIVEDNYEESQETEFTILRRANFILGEDYEARFHRLLQRGYHWINLHCAGRLDKDLIFTIELPTYTSEGIKTSVNYSGPSNPIFEDPEWDIEKGFEIR
jgi:hypothetical protein